MTVAPTLFFGYNCMILMSETKPEKPVPGTAPENVPEVCVAGSSTPAGPADAASTEAVKKIDKGRETLACVENDSTVNAEITPENLSRWTVVLEDYLKERFGDDFSKDHEFVALQLIKQKYFDGKNLFTAMKDAISEEGVYLINLDDDDLRNIRTSTREMQRSRTLIANDWGEF